jgi:hypothetical protein
LPDLGLAEKRIGFKNYIYRGWLASRASLFSAEKSNQKKPQDF